MDHTGKRGDAPGSESPEVFLLPASLPQLAAPTGLHFSEKVRER